MGSAHATARNDDERPGAGNQAGGRPSKQELVLGQLLNKDSAGILQRVHLDISHYSRRYSAGALVREGKMDWEDAIQTSQ